MKRDQTVYTCDGCKKTHACDLNETPRGWFRVTTAAIADKTQGLREAYLCMRCFTGVDWITRFQGVLVPPAIISSPTSMRGRENATATVESILDATVACPSAEDHHFMEHCGLCGWDRVGPLHVTVDVHDGPRGTQQPGATHVHNHGPGEGRGTNCREQRDGSGRLLGECMRAVPEEDKAKPEEPFSVVTWAEALLAARFPGRSLEIVREPRLDVDVRHNTLVDEYSLVLELRAVQVLTPQVNEPEEPTA